jgi:hypothetical protein
VGDGIAAEEIPSGEDPGCNNLIDDNEKGRTMENLMRTQGAFATALALAGLLLFGPTLAPAQVPTDIYVEVDYMTCPAHSHLFRPEEVAAVVQMFACHGINLHIEISDSIPHINVMRCDNLKDPFFTCSGDSSFAALKVAYCNHLLDPSWHYCIFAHQYDNGKGINSSGISEMGGDDFVVSLGGWTNDIGTPYDRACTFAHELGHNLGLRHCSPHSNGCIGPFSPNYASIMSYHYQLNGVRRQMRCLGIADSLSLFKQLDYSDGRLPPLDEDILDETVGVGMCQTDWDCDGSIDPTLVSQDLDTMFIWCNSLGPVSILRDNNDWTRISDKARYHKLHPEEEVEIVTCITLDEHKRMMDKNPFNCPNPQPTLTVEPCVSQLMIWADPAYTGGGEEGTGLRPYDTLMEAYDAAPESSVIYLQPGTYTEGGMPVVLDKPVFITGPGGAVVDP